jgi:hypothetical protein
MTTKRESFCSGTSPKGVYDGNDGDDYNTCHDDDHGTVDNNDDDKNLSMTIKNESFCSCTSQIRCL